MVRHHALCGRPIHQLLLANYAQSAVFGSNAFALAYGSQTVTDTRTEHGFRTDRSFAPSTGLLTSRSRFAWAHDYNPDRAIAVTFQALPGVLRRQRRGAGKGKRADHRFRRDEMAEPLVGLGHLRK
jgi:Autotransporter beta-domain